MKPLTKTHAALFMSGAGTLAYSHSVTADEMRFWEGYIFLPLKDIYLAII